MVSKMKTSKKPNKIYHSILLDFSVIAISFLVLGFLLGTLVADYRINEIESKAREEVTLLRLYVIQANAMVKSQYASRVEALKANDKPMSIEEAHSFLAAVTANHQYYIDHPEEQNKLTGDTSFNRDIVTNYNRLDALLPK